MRIFRGFDATYADFLMIPNKWWNIESDEPDFLRISLNSDETDKKVISIPKRYVVASIRRTATADEVVNAPDSYVINLNPSIIKSDPELNEFHSGYLKFMQTKIEEQWFEDKKKGHKRVEVPEGWYAHPNRYQCAKTVGTFSISTNMQLRPGKRWLHTRKPCQASILGFGYIVQTQNSLFYASWMNSSFYY